MCSQVRIRPVPGAGRAAVYIAASAFFCLAAVAGFCLPARALTPPPPEASPSRSVEENTPKPPEETRKFVSPREETYRKKVSALVARLTKIGISNVDRKQLKAAVSAIRKGNLQQVISHRAAISDPTAVKIVDWLKLRAGFGTLADYRKFRDENPLWPVRKLFARRLEAAAFIQGGTVSELLSLFRDAPPETGMGFAALASAKLASGDTDGAREAAAKAWRSRTLQTSVEVGFLERFDALLKPADHLARINGLLAADYSSSRARRSRAAAVRRLLARLSPDDQKIVAARIAVYLDQKGADKLVAALPKAAQADPHLKRQLAQRARRKKRLEKATKMMIEVPGGLASGDAEADWRMRERLAWAMIANDKHALAYKVIANARPPEANSANAQAFQSGWLALRYMKAPKVARDHLKRATQLADGPLSGSRAWYWLGRAEEKLGNRSAAQAAYKKAAGFRDTFHSSLARLRLDPAQRKLALPFPDLPSAKSVAEFKKQSAVRAAVIAHKSDLPGAIVRALFGEFAWRVDDGAQIILLAQLAEDLGDSQIAVRAGKAGVARGHAHFIYSYPIHRFPLFEPVNAPPEPALILSIARQESEFNARAVSRVGARGLLQVMPATARGVCRTYKLTCNVRELRSSLAFNAKIAALYITDQMRNAGGNMILTLTSYNAGPGRTRQWLREHGDPRDAKVDALDWVYQIPFEETRLYVQKVISNLQVYRARLATAKAPPNRIDRDLGLASAQ